MDRFLRTFQPENRKLYIDEKFPPINPINILCSLEWRQHLTLHLWMVGKRLPCIWRDTQQIPDPVVLYRNRFGQLLWRLWQIHTFPYTYLPLLCTISVLPFPSVVDRNIWDAIGFHVQERSVDKVFCFSFVFEMVLIAQQECYLRGRTLLSSWFGSSL